MSKEIEDDAKKLKAIIETAIDGIIIIDDVGIIEDVNPAGAKLFGYDTDEIVGKNISILMPEPFHSEHDEYIERFKKTKEPRVIGIGREVLGKRKDGQTFPFRLALSQVVLVNRTIFTGVIHDLSEVKSAQKRAEELNRDLEIKVTERTYELEKVVNQLLASNTNLEAQITVREEAERKLIKQEEELRQALAKEKDLNELKSRFVSMASHEFRTPLTSILSSASLLTRYVKLEEQPKREKHIDRIKSSVSNINGILNDFLSISQLEERKIEVNLVQTDLNEVCKQILEETKGLLKPNQHIIHNFGDRQHLVLVDVKIIRNILFNLISNATKYSEDDIICETVFNKKDFNINIRDKGIGIPIEDQKHLFSRFFRAGNVTNIQGTGLGLNIVKEYVEILGGTITFESIHEEGSCFTVSLPYTPYQ